MSLSTRNRLIFSVCFGLALQRRGQAEAKSAEAGQARKRAVLRNTPQLPEGETRQARVEAGMVQSMHRQVTKRSGSIMMYAHTGMSYTVHIACANS